jgi:hypothetical protein
MVFQSSNGLCIVQCSACSMEEYASINYALPRMFMILYEGYQVSVMCEFWYKIVRRSI